MPSFHLSLSVRSLDESADFFTRVLGATVSHRDPAGYVNIDLFGTQITLTAGRNVRPDDDVHFGVNLTLAEFDALTERILASGYEQIIAAPTTVDGGTPLERKKMYLRCPTGYLVELKGYGARGDSVARPQPPA